MHNLSEQLRPLVYLSNNPFSFLGVLLTTTGGVAWLFILPIHTGARVGHPYLGILFYLVLPILFVAGLILIPLGVGLRRRKYRRRGTYSEEFLEVNWANPAFRQMVSFVSAATIANIIIGGHLILHSG